VRTVPNVKLGFKGRRKLKNMWKLLRGGGGGREKKFLGVPVTLWGKFLNGLSQDDQKQRSPELSCKSRKCSTGPVGGKGKEKRTRTEIS